MAIVGGFLGGGVEMVPEGMSQLCMQWLTPDRLNIEGAVFKGQGPNGETFTVGGGADGRVDMLVPAGRWAISVEHDGVYDNDKPQIVDAESAQAYLVYFGGTAFVGGVVISDYLIGGTITIVDDYNSETIYTGDVVPGAISTGLGQFSIKVVQFGVTKEFNNIVIAGKYNLTLDTVPVTVSQSIMNFIENENATIKINEYVLNGSETSILSDVSSISVSIICNTMMWSNDMPVSFSKSYTNPGGHIEISNMVSDPFVITSSGDFNLPKAEYTYHLAICGGGGGGGGGSTGLCSLATIGVGGSGNGGVPGDGGAISSIVFSPSDTAYHVTIGGGGTGGEGGSRTAVSDTSSRTGTSGSSGLSTQVTGCVELVAAGGGGGSFGSAARLPSQSRIKAGNGARGGRGSNNSDFKLMNQNISKAATGSDGVGGQYTYTFGTNYKINVVVPGTESTDGETPIIPSDLSRFDGSGKSGKGGGNGYIYIHGSDHYTLSGATTRIGAGGVGLCINGIEYGVGGRGGLGGDYYGNNEDTGSVHSALEGQNGGPGVAVMELII